MSSISNTFIIFYFACLFHSIVSLTREEVKTKEVPVAIECAKQNNVNESVTADFFQKHIVPDSHDGKCFLHCFMVGSGYMNEEGKTDWEYLKQASVAAYGSDPTTVNKIATIADSCQKAVKPKADLCELSYDVTKCVTEGMSPIDWSADAATKV